MLISATIYSVLCLFVTGLFDLVLKLYSNKGYSLGKLIFGVGLIWGFLQWVNMEFNSKSLDFSAPTLFYGTCAAVSVTVSNILLLKSMEQLPISAVSTIYRLNTVPLVVFAYIFLHEEITFFRFIGIGFGLLTVFLLYQGNSNQNGLNVKQRNYILIIVSACFLRAFYGLFTKAGVNEGADIETMIFFGAIGWIIGGMGIIVFHRRNWLFLGNELKFVIIAGLLVYAIIWLLTNALMIGDATLIIPVTNMGFVAAFVYSVLLRMESMNLKKSFAIIAACLAVYFITATG